MHDLIFTCATQSQADEKLSKEWESSNDFTVQFRALKEEIHLEKFLETGRIRKVTCCGSKSEKGPVCHYEWVVSLREQCVRYHVEFYFLSTGHLFEKDGKLYHIQEKYQISQAEKAGLDFTIVRKKHAELFARLGRSGFRSSFSLKGKDKEYVKEKGLEVIETHARDFIEKRLTPAYIPNDGKQTPMRGHPVFIAQHATGVCCRGCLEKWHHIPAGRELTKEEQDYVVSVIMEWIKNQMKP